MSSEWIQIQVIQGTSVSHKPYTTLMVDGPHRTNQEGTSATLQSSDK